MRNNFQLDRRITKILECKAHGSEEDPVPAIRKFIILKRDYAVAGVIEGRLTFDNDHNGFPELRSTLTWEIWRGDISAGSLCLGSSML